MKKIDFRRRDACRKLGDFSLGMGAVVVSNGCATIGTSESVKWSTGTEFPTTKVLANSCDCHHHIYDLRYSWAPEATLKPGEALVPDYRKLQNPTFAMVRALPEVAARQKVLVDNPATLYRFV